MYPRGFGVVAVSIFWHAASQYANYEYVKRVSGPDEDVTLRRCHKHEAHIGRLPRP